MQTSFTAFVSTELLYSLFLADRSAIYLVASEVNIFPIMMRHNAPGPQLWHLRDDMSAGISSADTERIQQCLEMIAHYAGRPIDKLRHVEVGTEKLHNI